MKIKTELIKSYIADVVCSQISDFEIDEEKIADTKATVILAEIQSVVCQEELSDFEIVEKIIFCLSNKQHCIILLLQTADTLLAT